MDLEGRRYGRNTRIGLPYFSASTHASYTQLPFRDHLGGNPAPPAHLVVTLILADCFS
jgi:hypothetical protein